MPRPRLDQTFSGILMSARFLAGVSLALLSSTAAFAHGDHGGGAGIVLPHGVVLVSAEYDVVQYKGISDARLGALANAGVEEVHSLTSIAVPALNVGYGVTDDFTIGLRLPYLDNEEIREVDATSPTGVNARGGVQGIGDMSFTGTYRFLHEETAGIDASITLGVKAPTGKTDVHDRHGELFETEHQPGSGSWDGIAGGTLSKSFGPLSLSATAVYGFTGEGSQSTTLGDRFNYGVTATYRILLANGGVFAPMHLGSKFDGMMHHGGVEHHEEEGHHDHGGPTLDLSVGLNGQWWDKQVVAGEADGNTGGNVLFITPGVRLTVDNWAGFVSVGIPVATDLNGIQSEPDWQLSAGTSVQF